MRVLNFENHEDLAEFMMDIVKEDEKIVYAVLFYEDARQLLKELASYNETIIGNIELTDPLNKGYNKEFYVILDSEYRIDVEEAWHDKNEYHDQGYYWFGDKDVLALVHSDVNSKVIEATDGSTCYEIEIEEDLEKSFKDIEKEDFFDFLEFCFR